jgi:hypothetical protein
MSSLGNWLKALRHLIGYRELFGEESKSPNKQFLLRRIAYRLQAIGIASRQFRATSACFDVVYFRSFGSLLPL